MKVEVPHCHQQWVILPGCGIVLLGEITQQRLHKLNLASHTPQLTRQRKTREGEAMKQNL